MRRDDNGDGDEDELIALEAVVKMVMPKAVVKLVMLEAVMMVAVDAESSGDDGSS